METRFLPEDYLVSDLVWTSSVICKLIFVECDIKLWVWSNSVSVTSRPKIIDVIGWLTWVPLTSESKIVEVSVSAAVPVSDDLYFF